MTIDPVIGAVHYNLGNYVALPDDFAPYHYEDEVAVLKLLGRDPALPDRNEALQTSARGAQVCTFSALAESEAAKDALVALWATQTTHDLGDGVAARTVALTKVDTQLLSWGGATPVYKVTLTTRTR